MGGFLLVVLRCPVTGEERDVPAVLAGRVEIGDQVRYGGRLWRVVDPYDDSVT